MIMGIWLIAYGLCVGPLWAKEMKGKIRREKRWAWFWAPRIGLNHHIKIKPKIILIITIIVGSRIIINN